MRRRSSWQLIAVFKIRFKLCTTFKALQDLVNCLEILGFYSFPSGFLQLILFPLLFFFLSAPSPNSSFILRYYLDYCFYLAIVSNYTFPKTKHSDLICYKKPPCPFNMPIFKFSILKPPLSIYHSLDLWFQRFYKNISGMPKQRLTQLHIQVTAFLNEPMAPRSVLNSLGSYYALSGSPQQRTHLSTRCPGPLVSNPALSLCSLAPQLLILLLAHAG